MKRPTRRDIAIWMAFAGVAVLAILEAPRDDPYRSGSLVIPGLVVSIGAGVKDRRAGASWLRSLRTIVVNLIGFVVLAGAFAALSMRFGRVRTDPFDTSLDLVGWGSLVILVVLAWIAVLRVFEFGPFRPKAEGSGVNR